MKKLLSLIGAFSVIASSSVSVISCVSNTANGLSNEQITSAAQFAEVTAMSQTDSFNIKADDSLNFLESNSEIISKNLNSIFLSKGSNDDFSSDSPMSMMKTNNQISEATSILPSISIPGQSPIPIVTLIGSLQTFLPNLGATILPMLLDAIVPSESPDYSIVEDVFNSGLLRTNGQFLKDTIGEPDSSGTKLVINDSIYAGKSYNEVLSEAFSDNNFVQPLTSIINKIISEKDKPIDEIIKDLLSDSSIGTEISNLGKSIMVLLNYLSQFSLSEDSNLFRNNEQILYNTPKTNEDYKADILNENFTALNANNFSTFFTNLENSDNNSGLGFQQLIFNVFGSTPNSTFNNQPLGKALVSSLSNILKQTLPSISIGKEQIDLILNLSAQLLTQISENKTLDDWIKILQIALSTAGSSLGPEIEKGLNSILTNIQNNPNWFTGEKTTAGTTWTDLWQGTGDNSLINVLWKGIYDIFPSELSKFGDQSPIENIDQVYKILESIPIQFNKTAESGPTSLLTIKTLFETLGKDQIIYKLLSPSNIGAIENALNKMNDDADLKTDITKSYDNLCNIKGINSTNANNFIKSINPEDASSLVYLLAMTILYRDNSKDTSISSQIAIELQTIFKQFVNTIIPSDVQDKIFNQLSVALQKASTIIFDESIDSFFNKNNWKIGKVIRSNNDYLFTISWKGIKNYQVKLTKNSNDNYYKIYEEEIN